MAGSVLVRQARLPGRPAAEDVLVLDGRIAEPEATAPADIAVVDAEGLLLLPGFVDAHCHVDKTLWSGPWVPHAAGPRLVDRIANERARRTELGLPSATHAAALLAHMATLGTTRVRTHTDVDPATGLAGIEAVAKAAAAVAGLVDVEQVAFPQDGVIRRPGTLELLEEALAAGATTLGGIDPAGVDQDPVRQLDALFDLAARHGAGIDMHLHDTGTLGAWEMDLVAERTVGHGLQGKVTLSHADALGTVPDSERHRLLDVLAEAGINVVTAAVYNVPVPSVVELRDRGVTLACGSDGIRDLWGPYGNGDMLERAMHVAYRNGVRRDEDIALALDAATYGAARVLGLSSYGLEPGSVADLVLVPARTVAEAVVARPPRAVVVKNGDVIARDGRLV
ncbi:MAG: amidohydrolase family protein [Nocardioidaceae bacterium]|nr:amidohydrolase family protein [Nocardioidaceae bacterium]